MLEYSEDKQKVNSILKENEGTISILKELCELQTEYVNEDRGMFYPMEIYEFEDEETCVSITNPFLDSTGRFELKNPIAVYGKEAVEMLLHDMNDEIYRYVEAHEDSMLKWDNEKAFQDIQKYCRDLEQTKCR